MNAFTIAGIIGILVIFLGLGLAFLFVKLSQMVTANQLALENEQSSTNPSLTMGYEIPVKADLSEQLAVARKIAARKAAALPRGANMRIGRLGHTNLKTAGKAVEQDPYTAVKIAAFHTWQGAKVGPPVGGVAQEAPVARQAARPVPTKKPEDLVAGEDYPFIEVTDDMSADEVRRARIANAKARSAAVKALKEQAAAPAAPAAAPARGATAPASPAAAAGIEEPDYIEITDDMPADEVRKARIHNARARSAYMKALKAAGVEPGQTGGQAAAAAAPTAAAPETAAPAAPEVPQDIEPPDYVEITDDMPADAVRKARVQNARERSRFFKALKDRGIDPKDWEAGQQDGAAATPQPAASAPAAEPEQAAGGAETAIEIPDNISEPEYIEITDDMTPDEVRQARVHNSRERSRYFKALKDAGIDPKSVAERT
ncbi:MAG TPA: hypothetical protein VE553_07885 [Candidatus Binatia bacterium]|nr:hypothetical protein [Candidatus Binatia bacterium]